MNPDSGSVAVADTRAVIPRCRISTRVYKKIGDIEVHVRHFEIGDCGPGLGEKCHDHPIRRGNEDRERHTPSSSLLRKPGVDGDRPRHSE